MDLGQKRQRVSKGQYNKYLKRKDPYQHAPASSKRQLTQIPREHLFQTDSFSHSDINSNGTICHSQQKDTELGERLFAEFDFGEKHSKSGETHKSNELREDLRTQDEKKIWEMAKETENQVSGNSRNDSSCVSLHVHQSDSQNTVPIAEMEENVSKAALASECLNEEVKSENLIENDKKVFTGSRLSLGSFMVLMMTFVLKYSLTGEGLGELLNIIDLLCPSENNLMKSIASFKRWFKKIKHPLKVHKYCSFCHLGLNEKDIISNTCPNDQCKKILNDVSHFIEIPIAEQIKSFFARPSFITDIYYRFTRKNKQNYVEDIYDGEVYRALCQKDGLLADPHNLSLLWNTDGIPCFKSSNMSLWPLFFQINELQYTKRSNTENMILGGLWFGPKKPTMISYTEPFIKSLKDLETTGIYIDNSINTDIQDPFFCKVLVIGGTADLPARSVVCNTTQFNGKYGCCKCLQPGETHKISARGHCHVFPFNEDNPTGPKRTHQQFLEDVENAVQNSKISRGIKGPSFLQCLTFYNLVSGTCIDYMHGILLGVTKLLMSLWFSQEHSGKIFSLYSYVGVADKRLKYLKPPNNITRLPRSIRDHFKYWKATEFRSWLLYYSLPILRDIQSVEYYQHFLLLVNAVFILLKDSISPEDIDKSNALITHFCCLFAALYGDRYMTCNIHQLLHLPDMVKQMGPLWAYSCFPFENANGNILNFFNGTQNVDFQIVETVNLMQTLTKLQKEFLIPDSPEEMLYRAMKGTLSKNGTYLQDNIYVVGGTSKKHLKSNELEAISLYLGHMPHHFITFKRIRIGNEVFHSRCYTRVHARNSYTVAYNDSNGIKQIGQVVIYLQLFPYCNKHHDLSKFCKCITENVALVNPLKKHENPDVLNISADKLSGADLDYMSVLHPVNLSECLVIPLRNILYKCVFIEIEDKKSVVYACKMPNYFEKD